MMFSPILGPQIPPFAPAVTVPPQTTVAFFRWALRGSWAGITWASFWSVAVGSLEAVSATFLGMIIDAVATADKATVFVDHGALLAGFAIYYLCLLYTSPSPRD